MPDKPEGVVELLKKAIAMIHEDPVTAQAIVFAAWRLAAYSEKDLDDKAIKWIGTALLKMPDTVFKAEFKPW